MKVTKLDWDSNFFGIKVAELVIHNPIKQAIEVDDTYDLIYAKGKVDTLAIHGFSNNFSETKVLYSKRVTPIKKILNNNIFPISDIDYNLSQIQEIAYESGKYSRFKLDTKFKDSSFHKLYNEWVINSINKTFATELLVYVQNKTILGLVSYKTKGNESTIGLIGVHPNAQGKGIGSSLLQSVELIIADQGISVLKIPTQIKNKAACLFYEKHGYSIEKTEIIKHYWKI